MVAPIIRFDSCSEDWQLESIGSVISNKSKKYDPVKAEEDFPCIELEHLSQQTGEILDTISAKDQKSIKNIFDENSVLFGKLRPYLRKFAKPNFKGVCSSEIWVLTSTKLQSNFLFQYIQTDSFSELTQIQAGSKMPRADWESISKGEIYFPNFEEQTKIATFLSAVDEKISQLSQKLHLLGQYKQGMMQKLFSQQIRFKADDGSEFGEWETKSIKDIADVKGGKRIPKGYSLVNENTGHPYITVSDMNRSYSIDNTNIRYVPLEVVEAIKRYTITDKDIFISVAGTLGIIGKIPPEFNGANLTENADKLTNLKCHQDFLIYLLDSGCLSELIESTATTSAQPKLALYAIEQLEINMPCLEEQTKIANFLSAIDQKIDVVSGQLEQAKLWKKGLLQQMFV